MKDTLRGLLVVGIGMALAIGADYLCVLFPGLAG